MGTLRSLLSGIVLTAAAVTTVCAQPREMSAASVDVTLAQAIDQALERNLGLTVSRRDVEISQGRLRQARRYPFNPELGLDGDIGRATAREDSDRRGVGGGRVGLSQVIEIRGQRGWRIAGAEADLARVEWAARDTRREVIAETTKAFSALLVAQDRLALSQEGVNLATGLKSTVDTLVESGSVPEVDAVRANVELRRALNRLTLDEAAANSAARSLALLIGAPANAAVRAAGPLLIEPVPQTLDDLLRFARANRPDLRAALAAVENAQASLRLIQAERFLPSLTLSASYGEALDFDSTSRRALFGVSIPLPLWNRRDGDLRAAEAEVRKQEALRNRIVAEIEKEVTTTFPQVIAATKVVDEYATRIVPGQAQSAALIQQGYRLGQFRLTEALLAQRDLIDIRSAYLEAIAAYNTAVADLRKAAGVEPR